MNSNNTGSKLLTIGGLTFNPDMAVIEWGWANDEPTAVVTIIGVVYDDHGTNSQCWRFKGFEAAALKHEMDRRSYDVVYEYKLHCDRLVENKQKKTLELKRFVEKKCTWCGTKLVFVDNPIRHQAVDSCSPVYTKGEACGSLTICCACKNDDVPYNPIDCDEDNEQEHIAKIKRMRFENSCCIGCGAKITKGEKCKPDCPGEDNEEGKII